MGRRTLTGLVVLSLALAVAFATGSAAGDPGSERAQVEARIDGLEGRIAESRRREGVLTDELSAMTARIRAIEGDVAAEQSRLSRLEQELGRRRALVERLGRRIREQSERLERLREQHARALVRLERRVRQIYIEDTPDAVSFVLGASTFADLLDTLEFLDRIGRQDERITEAVRRTAGAVSEARAATRQSRDEASEEARAIAAQVAEQRAARDRIVSARDALRGAEAEKARALTSVRESREAFTAEVTALEVESAALAARIQAAQAAAATSGSNGTGASASPSGLAWPVSGSVTSGFGPRWGRRHEGIDIAVPVGTAVHAAAAGTVIGAGWVSGYGNLVVVDHGNGLATAYAHNSAFAVGVGQRVEQGQVVAYSGNTGNSSGPHVHFEVRVNGSAVDPLGYL